MAQPQSVLTVIRAENFVYFYVKVVSKIFNQVSKPDVIL